MNNIKQASVFILFLMAIVSAQMLSSCSSAAVFISATPEITETLIPGENAAPSIGPQTPTPVLTFEPTPSPTPARTIEPGAPDSIGIYTRASKPHLLKEYKGPWKRGKDIYVFDIYASNEAVLKKTSHKELILKCWNRFSKASDYKIGYFLNFTLKSGEEINMTIRYPKDAPKDPKVYFYQYVEVYTYDNIHPGAKLYHLMESTTNKNTLMTSIKLTSGVKISEVTSINLMTFVFKDDSDFDPVTGRYIGLVSHEIPVIKQDKQEFVY